MAMIHRDTMRCWRRDANAWNRAWYWKGRCLLTERLFWLLFGKKRIGRAHHMADLEEKLAHQKRTIHYDNEAARARNEQLKATNLIIACTGCDAGFRGDFTDITEETICEVERTATRLRKWWENHKYHMDKDQ